MNFEDYVKQRKQEDALAQANLKAKQAAADTEAAQAKVDTASSKTNTGLGGFLSSLINGVGEKIGDVGEAVGTTLATPIAAFNDAINKHNTTATNEDASNKRNEIAKKYGFSSYSDALSDANADKLSDDFWNDIKSANNETKERIAQNEAIAGQSAVDKYVQNKDANEFAGQALSTMGTIADVLPGGGLAGNVISGTLEGMGDSFKNAKGKAAGDVDLADALSRAGIGAASSAVASGVGNKLASASGAKSLVGKALQSNIGKGALTGAAAGATSGALTQGFSSVFAGEDLGSVLSNTWNGAMSGAGSGAVGGAVMSGAQGLANKGIQAVSNKLQGINSSKTADIADTTEPITKEIQETAEPTAQDTAATKAQQRLDAKNAYNNRGEALASQYSGTNTPMARATGGISKNANKVLDTWGAKTPDEVSMAHDALTGNNGIVTKINDAALLDTPDVNLADVDVDTITSGHGLKAKDAQALSEEIKALSTKYHSDGKGTFDATSADSFISDLEDIKAGYLGKGDTYHRATSTDKNRAKAIQGVIDSVKSKLDDNVPTVKQVLETHPELAAELEQVKTILPNNTSWSDNIDKNIINSKNMREARSSVSSLVNMDKIAQDSAISSSTNFGKLSSGDLTNKGGILKTTANAIDSKLGITDKLNKTATTNRVNNAIDDYANKKAVYDGTTQPTTTKAKSNNAILNELNNLASDAKSLASKPINAARNLISAANSGTAGTGNAVLDQIINGANNLYSREANRQIAQEQYENYGNQLDLQNAQAELQEAQSAEDAAQRAYDTAMSQTDTSSTNTALAQSEAQLANIQNAMQSALAAGDITSYSTLADLYNTAYSIYEAQAEMYGSSSSSSTSNLTTSQQSDLDEANNSLDLLDQLETAYNNAGGAQGFVSGNLQEFLNSITGGNANASLATYNSLKESLGTSIVKNVVNLGGTEADAQRYLAMLPSATDTAEQAAQKIRELRKMLQNAKANIGSSN